MCIYIYIYFFLAGFVDALNIHEHADPRMSKVDIYFVTITNLCNVLFRSVIQSGSDLFSPGSTRYYK